MLHSAATSRGVSVALTLDKAPVAGVPIVFRVTITNKETVAKEIIEHLNAQAKQYNHSPSDTFWEAERVVKLAPLEGKFATPYIYSEISNLHRHRRFSFLERI